MRGSCEGAGDEGIGEGESGVREGDRKRICVLVGG